MKASSSCTRTKQANYSQKNVSTVANVPLRSLITCHNSLHCDKYQESAKCIYTLVQCYPANHSAKILQCRKFCMDLPGVTIIVHLIRGNDSREFSLTGSIYKCPEQMSNQFPTQILYKCPHYHFLSGKWVIDNDDWRSENLQNSEQRSFQSHSAVWYMLENLR